MTDLDSILNKYPCSWCGAEEHQLCWVVDNGQPVLKDGKKQFLEHHVHTARRNRAREDGWPADRDLEKLALHFKDHM